MKTFHALIILLQANLVFFQTHFSQNSKFANSSNLLLDVIYKFDDNAGSTKTPAHKQTGVNPPQSRGACGDWISFKDEKCIKLFEESGTQTKDAADRLCQFQGKTGNFEEDEKPVEAKVIVIKTKEEQKFIQNILFQQQSTFDNVWLGLEMGNNNSFTWNDGSQLFYSNWAKQDNANGGLQCVEMLSGERDYYESGQWVRTNCKKRNAVVCEKVQQWSMTRLQKELLQLRLYNEWLEKELEEKIVSLQKNAAEIINVARGKPVQQSTTFQNPSYVASNGNDGHLGTYSHTDVNDRYPWWRVDLLRPYDVLAVAVYAFSSYHERRFHDVSIVVSNIDISTAPPKTYFNPGSNSVCLDNIGSESPVDPGWTTFNCKQVVSGRYVSLQITADCRPGRNDCNHPSDTNIAKNNQLLGTIEVEVYVPWHRG